MDSALAIFLNGILGVFAGMIILYAAIRVISLIAGVMPGKDRSS